MWKKWNTIFFNCRYSIGRSSSSRFYPLGWRSRYWYATFRLWTFYNGLCYRLDERFFLQNWNTDKHFGLPFSKIRLNNTHYIERNAEKVHIHDGIYVDVFPFDSIPDNYKLQRWQNLQSYILKRLILIKNNYKCWEKKRDGKINYL